MTTTFRNALLALVLILGLAGEIKAQDRYEYATLAYSGVPVGKSYTLFVSTANSFSTIDGKITEGNIMQNTSPIIAKAEEMGKDGWEVYNTEYNAISLGYTCYYLRRKAK
jgi:hypothetical protein